MKLRGSFFILAFVSLMFLSLLVLGIPVSGFALEAPPGTSPHVCTTNNSHQPTNLGGVTSFPFLFAKVCSPAASLAVQWKFFIYNYDNNALLCSWGPFNLPPITQSKTCGPTPALPMADYQIVKVVINYKTSTAGAWMTHTELFINSTP